MVEERARARVGQTLNGKYRLDRLLGVGGMAAVYAATHRNKKRVAVKMLHPELSVHEELRARFLREGYVANTVEHPGRRGGARRRRRRGRLGVPRDGAARGRDARRSVRPAGRQAAAAVRCWPSPSSCSTCSPRRTRRTSCTATSSRRTCSSRGRGSSRCSTSASRGCATRDGAHADAQRHGARHAGVHGARAGAGQVRGDRRAHRRVGGRARRCSSLLTGGSCTRRRRRRSRWSSRRRGPQRRWLRWIRPCHPRSSPSSTARCVRAGQALAERRRDARRGARGRARGSRRSDHAGDARGARRRGGARRQRELAERSARPDAGGAEWLGLGRVCRRRVRRCEGAGDARPRGLATGDVARRHGVADDDGGDGTRADGRGRDGARAGGGRGGGVAGDAERCATRRASCVGVRVGLGISVPSASPSASESASPSASDIGSASAVPLASERAIGDPASAPRQAAGARLDDREAGARPVRPPMTRTALTLLLSLVAAARRAVRTRRRRGGRDRAVQRGARSAQAGRLRGGVPEARRERAAQGDGRRAREARGVRGAREATRQRVHALAAGAQRRARDG